MLTLALYGLLAVLLIGGLYLLAARLLPAGEQIAPSVRDEPIWELPAERALVASDVADVRLPVALRGYRFAETDLLLDRLVEELRARDEEIARLRGLAPSTATAPTLGAPAGEETYEPLARPEPAPAPEEAAPKREADRSPESEAESEPEPEAESEPEPEPTPERGRAGRRARQA